jgi:phosphohistidine phosphatase
MAKTLILIRHSKAETRDNAINDFERSLTSEGIADSKKMADFLFSSGTKPDIIVTSSAARASETAIIFADILKTPAKMFFPSRKLYYCSAKTILDQIYGVADSNDCILVVAHNPGISDLTRGLSSGRTFFMENTQTTVLQYEIDHWYELGESKPVKFESFTLKDI